MYKGDIVQKIPVIDGTAQLVDSGCYLLVTNVSENKKTFDACVIYHRSLTMLCGNTFTKLPINEFNVVGYPMKLFHEVFK